MQNINKYLLSKISINNITKSTLKILPPRKKIETGNVIYNYLHFLVLYLYNLILNRHWHIKFKTYYIRIRKTFSFLFIKMNRKGWSYGKGFMDNEINYPSRKT